MSDERGVEKAVKLTVESFNGSADLRYEQDKRRHSNTSAVGRACTAEGSKSKAERIEDEHGEVIGVGRGSSTLTEARVGV
jgi:hypothetical protein